MSSTDRYSNSSLRLYQSCGLKYRLSRVEKLAAIAAGGRHDLDYGSAFAKAFQALYGPDGSVKAAQAAFTAAYPPDQYPAVLPNWSQGKTHGNGLAAIAAYARRWYEEDRHWEVLSVEKLEDVEDEAETSRVVRLDLVVRDDRDGLVYGCDMKTTGKYILGKSGEHFWSQFEPNSQIRTYALHLEQQYGQCGGFIINAISLKHRSKAYTPRTGPDKGVRQEAGDWHEFCRNVYNPNAKARRLETDNIAYWIARVEADKARNTWGYNTQECHRGGVECEYWKLCSAGWTWPEDEELIREHYYVACLAVTGDGRCQLEAGHDGEHDERRRPTAQDAEVVLDDDEIEEAVV